MAGERIEFLDDGDPQAWDLDTGQPGVGLFATAVQVWSIAQGRAVTVNEAALAFNVQPALIRQAVDYHYFMFLGDGDTIEHEGD